MRPSLFFAFFLCHGLLATSCQKHAAQDPEAAATALPPTPPRSAPAEIPLPTADSSPTAITFSSATSLVAGEMHSCILADGEVSCWGHGLSGQLGQGDAGSRAEAVPVKNLGKDVVSIAAGELHTCAIKMSGSVYCWGFNQSGAVGNGTSASANYFSGNYTHNAVYVPSLVKGLEGVRATSLAATRNSTCAVTSLGSVYCWGSGGNYELGDNKSGLNYHTGKAQKVSVLSGEADSIEAGENSFCARTTTGKLSCWGVLGSQPYPIQDLSPDSGKVRSLAMGDQHSCYTDEYNQLYCRGDNWYQQTTLSDWTKDWTLVPGEKFTKVATARKSTCGITPERTVRCWGICLHGFCGSEETAKLVTPIQSQDVFAFSTNNPVDIPQLSDVRDIAVGARHVCALQGSGRVKCWGCLLYTSVSISWLMLVRWRWMMCKRPSTPTWKLEKNGAACLGKTGPRSF